MIEENETPEYDQGPRHGSRGLFAGFLILAGILLFLGNLGILPQFRLGSIVPLLVLLFGLLRLSNARDAAQRLLGFVFAFFGGFFLLVSLGIFRLRAHDHSWPISLLLIAFGLAMLFKVLGGKGSGSNFLWDPMRAVNFQMPEGLNDFTLMGSVKRSIESLDYRGGNALSVLGNIEIDLRRARTLEPGQTVRLEASTILGAVKVRVPEDWRVDVRGACILGAYEDRTVPSRMPGPATTLILTGYCVLGAVEIED